jgi:hypothetical protein
MAPISSTAMIARTKLGSVTAVLADGPDEDVLADTIINILAQGETSRTVKSG